MLYMYTVQQASKKTNLHSILYPILLRFIDGCMRLTVVITDEVKAQRIKDNYGQVAKHLQ